jgi:hypothetical protein
LALCAWGKEVMPNPFDQFDSQVQPVPVQSLRPVIGNVAPEEQERKAREEQRDVTRLDVTLEEKDRNASKDQFDRITTFRKEFLTEPTVRQFREVQNSTKQIIDLANRQSDTPGPGDIALIFGYMKALDPGSVVREGEFATAENAGGVPEAVINAYNKFLEGGRLSPELKREFAQTAASIYNSRLNGYNTFAEDYRGLVAAEGADPDAQGIRIAEPITFGSDSPLGRSTPLRTAEEGESFLTTDQRDFLAKFTAAYDSGATLEELQALGATPFATQAELDEARRQGRRPTLTPEGRDPRSGMGFLEGIGETITGSARTTDEIEGLPDIGDIPELNDPSAASFLASLGSLTTGPQETAQIIASQFPGVAVRQDAKGNFLLRSSLDGKEYAIKPGFTASDIPRAIGAIAAFTPAGRATTLPGAFAANAGTQAGIEATQVLAGGNFNADEVLIAGAGGTAVQGIGRGISAVRGSRPSAPPPPSGPRVIADAPEVIAAGEAEKVPVLTSDVRPARTWAGNWLQSTGEKLPIVGTGGIRAGQQEARVGMVERLADEYASNPATIDDITADFMKTRGGEIAKYTQQKRDVFSSIAGAPAPVPQASLDALDLAIGRFGQQETYRPLVARIQGFRNDLANARSIEDIEDLRKAIGDTFNDDSMKSSSSALRGIVNGPDGLYAAIKKDMGGYIKDNAGEQGFAKWASSNAKLADFADDLEKGTLDRVLKRGEATPEEAASLLFSRKPSDVKALFRNLSPDGQKRARSLVVQKLVDNAGGLNELSTAKFRTALAKSKDTIGVVFPKDEAERLTGMLRLLQATKRAEQASVTTPTGQSTLPFVGASGLGFLAGDWFGAAGVGTATALGFRAYESKAVRNLLASLSKTQPGSKAEKNILANITKATAKASVPAAVNLQTRPDEQPTSTIEVR